jgi:RNA 3'-terminal phosphate cyclase (ATP)
MSGARDILNRARWARADLHTLAITVVHRGAPNDQRTLSGASVVAVQAGGVELTPDQPDGETGFVPYHRFVAIHAANGALLWDRHGAAAAPVKEAPEPVSEENTVSREVEPSFSVVLRERPLTIDGSAGEGGGQILRTALALSMLTGTPFVLERIRAARKKPGLMRQHLTCLRAAAAVCAAELEGAELGSDRLRFAPGDVVPGSYEFDVGSAGSTALVLQTIVLPLALAAKESELRVRGGTHALWAPIQPFLEHAWLPHLREMGARLALELVQAGFYPAGGGEVVLRVEPSTLGPLHLAPSHPELELSLTAIVANLGEGIARRELTSAAELLANERVQLHSATVRSPGPGNAIWLTARHGSSANVFSAIGERGVSAEDVGAACAQAFQKWRATGTSVEEHLADQLMLPIALAGEGSYTTSELTLHSRTNIEVIHAFTGKRLRVHELAAGFEISV